MITTELIKILRERTGAGILDCKKALVECEGNIDKASDWLREKGIAKAAKKADRIAAEGLTTVAIDNNYALICEVNSETDFVAKNEKFISFVKNIANASLKVKAKTLDEALNAPYENATINDYIVSNTAIIGEKLALRRIALLEKKSTDVFGFYLHMGGKIGSISILENSNNAIVAKDVAMHIAASSPLYIYPSDIPNEEIEKERHIQQMAAHNDDKLKDKPAIALEKILDGKINKWKSEISLVDQLFVKDPNITVGQYVSEYNTKIIGFVRFAVGEGLQKREDDFASEVMNQVNK